MTTDGMLDWLVQDNSSRFRLSTGIFVSSID